MHSRPISKTLAAASLIFAASAAASSHGMAGADSMLSMGSILNDVRSRRRKLYLGVLQRIRDAAAAPDFPTDPIAAYQQLIPLHFSENLPELTGHADPYHPATDRYVIYHCRSHGLMPERMLHHGTTPEYSPCPVCNARRQRNRYTSSIPENSTIYREWLRPSVESLLKLLAKEDPLFEHYHAGMLASREILSPALLTSPATYTDPGRNAPCPCGSGKKAKRCHFP